MRKLLMIMLSIFYMGCNSMAENLGESGSSESNWVDVHGAGSQRSDPKSGDPSEYTDGFGPQGDAIRINNLVRAVRLVSSADLPYTVVDTNQTTRFNNTVEETDSTKFYGQDADYSGVQASYTDNGDGTVSDNNTGLMWQQNPGEKMTWDEAHDMMNDFSLAGYDDWRIPTIKELYSLIQFSGRDVSPDATDGATPFIDTDYFDFSYGDTSVERIIDSQYMSATKYVSTTMEGDETVFGVNFADGRIKGYGMMLGSEEKTFYVMLVRGNTDYGVNSFVDNGDGTITDLATGLMWLESDSEESMNWEEALNWCEDLDYAGYTDWRLPDVKELQSIVDYSRSPDTTNSPAMDSIFEATVVENEAGDSDYGFYWSSTTHANSSTNEYGKAGAYVSFGRSLGNMANMERSGMGNRSMGSDRGRGPRPPKRR